MSADIDEFVEILIAEAGGMRKLAEKMVAGLNSASAITQARTLNTLTVFMKRAGLKKTGPSAMSDEEIDETLNIEMTRWLVSMSEDEFNGTIEKVRRTRASFSGVEEERIQPQEGGPALPPAG